MVMCSPRLWCVPSEEAKVASSHPRAALCKVLEYKNGKKNLLGLYMGEAMKNSKGTANPKLLNQLIIKELES